MATAAVKVEWELTQLTSLAGATAFARRQYLREGYGDSDDVTIPVDILYKLSPKADLSAGYRFRAFRTTVGPKTDDHFLNVGARGEFSPKLMGQVRFGYLSRHVLDGKTLNLLGIDGDLTHAITPKTSAKFTFSQRPDTNAFGTQQRNLSLGAEVSTAINEQWTAGSRVGYRAIRYPTRTDDYTEANVKIGYVVSSYITLEGSYAHAHNRSPRPSLEYSSNILRFAALLRY